MERIPSRAHTVSSVAAVSLYAPCQGLGGKGSASGWSNEDHTNYVMKEIINIPLSSTISLWLHSMCICCIKLIINTEGTV